MSNNALFIMISLIWGSTFYAITFQLGEVPKEWSLFYRFIIASILLFTFSHFTKRRLKFELHDHKFFLGLGLLLFSFNYYLTYLGTEFIPSGLVAIVFSILTLMNILNAAWLLKRPFEHSIMWAAVVGVIGIILLFLPEIERFSFTDTSVLGFWIILFASYSASLGNTLAATKKLKALPVIPTNAWGMLYGSILIASYAFITDKPIMFDASLPYVLSLGYLSIFGTVIAFTAYLVLLERIGPERAGYFAILYPVVALFLSTLFEGYHWTPESIAGIMLVLGGNYVVLRKKQESAEVKTTGV